MTNEQKKAIRVITELRGNNAISEEDFFLLLDFIIQEKVVFQPYNPTPLSPIYDTVTRGFDNQSNINKGSNAPMTYEEILAQ